MYKKLSEAIVKIKTTIGSNSSGFTSVIIWKIGITIFFAITLKEFIPLLDEYRNNNVATQIEIIGLNKSVKPPTLTFCVPWTRSQQKKIGEHLQKVAENENSTCIACDKMATNSWDVWRLWDLENMNNRSIDIELSIALMSKLFSTINDSTTTFDILNTSNSDWNQPLIDAIFNFFYCLNDFDASLHSNLSKRWCFQDPTTDLLLSNKTIIENLFSSFLNVLCDYMRIDGSQKNVCSSQLGRSPFSFYNQFFCFALPMLDNGRVASIHSAGSNGAVWTALNERETVGFMTQPGSGMTTWPRLKYETTDNIYESQQNAEKVFIRYLVALTVREKRANVDCYVHRSLEACKGACFITRIEHSCHCVPFSYRNYASTDKTKLPYCNSIDYKNCLLNQTEEIAVCETKCKIPCEYALYQWHVTQVPLDDEYAGAEFTIRPIGFPFVQFTTTYKMTWEQFLSQVGAVFNLYLGISGLSAITFIIYCAGLIRKGHCQREQKSIKVGDSANNIRENVKRDGISEMRVVDIENVESKEIMRAIEILKANVEEIPRKHITREEFKQEVQQMKTVLEDIKTMLTRK